MHNHQNPCRQKVSYPLCGIGSSKMKHQRKKSHSFKNTHMLRKTKSPSDYITLIDQNQTQMQKTNLRQKQKQKERQNIQRQILRMLQENNTLLGLLTDIDYDIKRKRQQINTLFQSQYKRTSQMNEQLFQIKESAYLKKLKLIKAKLGHLDIRQSLIKHKN